MKLTLFGISPENFLERAFINSSGDFGPEVVSTSTTRIVVRSEASGQFTHLIGSDLPLDPENNDLTGRLSRIDFFNSAKQLVGRIEQIDWAFEEFVDASIEAIEQGDVDRLGALLNARGLIDVDLTPAGGDTIINLTPYGVTVPVHTVGSTFNDSTTGSDADDHFRGNSGNDSLFGMGGFDRLFGGPGDDLLNPGFNNGRDDHITPGIGNDIVDFQDVTENSYATLLHDDLTGPITLKLDSASGSARVLKGADGITTLDSVSSILEAYGLAIFGTESNDRFEVNLAERQFLSLFGGKGADVFEINGSTSPDALVRINYNGSGSDGQTGISANLITGEIDDGLGSIDTLNVNGVNGALELRGSDFNDSILGSDADERFILRGGNDSLNAGDGWDLLRYDRGTTKTTAPIKVDFERGTVTGEWQGTAFTDTFTGIEEVRGTRNHGDRFYGYETQLTEIWLDGKGGDDILAGSGFQVSHDTEAAATVYRLYRATLDRAPDRMGHKNWAERIANADRTLAEAADGFLKSPEFKATYGNATNTEFVNLLYQNVLGRAADAKGLARWTGDLDSGVSRAEVVLGFSQSGEFRQTTASEARQAAENHVVANWADDVFRLYQATLGRDPDQNGLINWSTRLADGMELTQVIGGFVKSAEFKATYGTTTNAEFVTLLYNNVLGREPDTQGLTNWTTRLESGEMSREDVVRGFSQSGEFRAASKPGFTQWMIDNGQASTLEGGTGNDVLFSGFGADQFIINANDDGHDHIHGLEEWDMISMHDFHYVDSTEVIEHMTEVNGDIVFDNGTTSFTIHDTTIAELEAWDNIYL